MGGACNTYQDRRGAYRVLVGKPEGKRPLGKRRHRWQHNIDVELQEVGWGGVDWIDLAEDWALVNAIIYVRLP
jgi:hypothetical protein